MKGKIVFLTSLLLAAFVSSCEKGKSNHIEYNSQLIDDKNAETFALVPVATDFELGLPETIDFISDSLMVIFDTNINDKCAHIVDVNGRLIRSFGRKGKGEGELIVPRDITISQNRDSIFIYDSMLQRVLGYDVGALLRNEESIPSMYAIDINDIPGQEYRFFHVERGADGLFLGFSCGNNRIVSLDNGKTPDIYTDYPPADPDEETNWSIWNYSQSRISISPDRTKLVIATYIGGLFETFDINGRKVSSRALKGFFKPEYVYAEGARPKCVTFNPKKIVTGFRTVYASDDYFITVLDGPDSKRMNEILFFDYDGNLISRKVTDDGLINIVGEAPCGEIYAIAYNNELTQMNLYKMIK